MKRFCISPFLSLILVFSGGLAAAEKIPESIAGWRVEVGPPGNDFYQAPDRGASEKTGAKKKPPRPSDNVLQVVERIAPGLKISETEPVSYGRLKGFKITAENDAERYTFYITEDGVTALLEYEDRRADIEESPSGIVPKGKRREIPLEKAPARMLEILRSVMPGMQPEKAWYADTLVGPRYLVQVGEVVFYAVPSGRIRCAAHLALGGLKEVGSDATLGPLPPRDLEKVLGEFGMRFHFDQRIRQLQMQSPEPGQGFRFVVMGDSRSNENLWNAMVAHIASLKPKPAFLINTGDIVRIGHADEYRDYFLPPLLDVDIPLFVAIGNHDDDEDGMAHPYRFLFGEDSLNYFFDYGKARFVLLDNCTNVTRWEDALQKADSWLAQTPAGYKKYVFCHKPPATVEKWAYHSMGLSKSKPFDALMAKHHVDGAFFGHIHAYSTAVRQGIPYTVTGGAGAGLHDRYGPKGNVHHYLLCDVDGEGNLTQRVIRFYRETDESS